MVVSGYPAFNTTVDGTTTLTETLPVVTGTITSFARTETVTSTTFTELFTCGIASFLPVPSNISSAAIPTISFTLSSVPGGPTNGSIFSTPQSGCTASSAIGNLSITAIRPVGSTTASSPIDGSAVEKRDKTIFFTPRCLRRFSRQGGADEITSACECLALATPAPLTSFTTTVDPSTTLTLTNTVQLNKTITSTPQITKTIFTNATAKRSTTTTLISNLVSTANATYTVTTVRTSTITTSSPTPSSFNIYYVNSTADSSNPPSNFFRAVTAPGGSGLVITSEGAADSFRLDSLSRLVDATDGDQFIAKNTDDLYPFEILQSTAATSNTPVCSACNGILQCDYPGTRGNTFALCYGYLALGLPSVFGKDSNGDGHVDCEPIILRFK